MNFPRKLLRNVTEVHDDPSTRSKELLASASIKERPKVWKLQHKS